MGVITKDGLYQALEDAKEEDVLTNTGIAKSTWLDMYTFVQKAPRSRNAILHKIPPDSRMIKEVLANLESKMDEAVSNGFYKLLAQIL